MAHDPCSECAQDNRLTVCAECMQDAERGRTQAESAQEDTEQAGAKALLCDSCKEEGEAGKMICAVCDAEDYDETMQDVREALADLLALFDGIPDAALTDLGGAQRIDYTLAIAQAREVLRE